ncbi:hypothetical protein HVX13_15325 [Citrobacter freundii]|nr:hypothetical protein [Citrobacter freundii]MBA8332754.1 hypothetical protein [Citrobacter freundii]QLM87144.1 hypothetical protein HVX13_15325 [Citrobacter freundii]QMM23097.1 hypothetical protein HVX18_15315 [Citrobacter freundii]
MGINECFDKINSLQLEKSKWCSLGIFYRAFIERSTLLTDELFPYINSSLEKSSFQFYIMSIFNKKNNTDVTYEYLNEIIDNSLTCMSMIINNSYKNVHGSEDYTYISSNYEYYYIGSLLFDDYIEKLELSDLINMKYAREVETKYKNIGIELNTEDIQFNKYKLLSLNNNITICNNKDSQTIQDNRLGGHFWIPVPRKLLFSLQELINLGMVSDISFRIDNITKYIPFLEDIEQGTPLKLNVTDLPPLSKFYSSDNYADTFWVHHDSKKKSITFEELRDDFQMANDDVITQVIHLEYFNLNNVFHIQHLDHELISYTLEQYEKKLLDSKIKGYKKTKSFKIDNAKIPFMFKNNNEFLLFQVLDTYFKNSDLISEYFNNIEQGCDFHFRELE